MSDRISDPLVIGLSGYAQVGKDTVAELLGSAGYQRHAFADRLRDAALTLDPIIPTLSRHQRLSMIVARYGWEQAKVQFPEVRRLLQVLGTDVGRRMFGDNVWVELAFAAVPAGARVVFSDVRFQNEADACKNAGGQVWRIERPGCGPVNGHLSETALDGYDFDRVIVNWGTVDDLAACIDELLNGTKEVA